MLTNQGLALCAVPSCAHTWYALPRRTYVFGSQVLDRMHQMRGTSSRCCVEQASAHRVQHNCMMLTSGSTCCHCLQVAHLAQHFKASAALGPGVPIGQRSFLGGLLPESLLHVLTSYGAGAFAAALCGDADTPELVWTHRMRAQRLVPQVCLHGRRNLWPHLASVNPMQQDCCIMLPL